MNGMDVAAFDFPFIFPFILLHILVRNWSNLTKITLNNIPCARHVEKLDSFNRVNIILHGNSLHAWGLLFYFPKDWDCDYKFLFILQFDKSRNFTHGYGIPNNNLPAGSETLVALKFPKESRGYPNFCSLSISVLSLFQSIDFHPSRCPKVNPLSSSL